jgi:UDPglucose 6-dehydrogenase
MENVKKILGDKINFAKDEYEALKGADALVVATEWALFRTPDFNARRQPAEGKGYLRRSQPLRSRSV